LLREQLPSLLLQVFLCGHQWFLHGFVLLSASLFGYKCMPICCSETGASSSDVVQMPYLAAYQRTAWLGMRFCSSSMLFSRTRASIKVGWALLSTASSADVGIA
jgi:hypothetical protein